MRTHTYILLLPFIATHMLFGRLVSVPTAMAIFGRWYIAVILVVCIDAFLVPVFYSMFGLIKHWNWMASRLRLFRRILRKWIERVTKSSLIRGERKLQSDFARSARRRGSFGVFCMAALPFIGGGIWTSMLLAKTLKKNCPPRGLLLYWEA